MPPVFGASAVDQSRNASSSTTRTLRDAIRAATDTVIDVHIANLRRKVDRDESRRLIHTIRGVGFMPHVGEP